MTDDIELGRTNEAISSSGRSGESVENRVVSKDYKLDVPEERNDEVEKAEENENEDESSPIWYCHFVVSHYRLAFGKCTCIAYSDKRLFMFPFCLANVNY